MRVHLFMRLLSLFWNQNVSSKGLFYLLLYPQGLHTACALLTFADPIGVLSLTPIHKEVCSSFKTHLKGSVLKRMILSSTLLYKVQTHRVLEHPLQDTYVQGSGSQTVNRSADSACGSCYLMEFCKLKWFLHALNSVVIGLSINMIMNHNVLCNISRYRIKL